MYDKVKLLMARTKATPDVGCLLDKPKEQTDIETGEVRVFGSLNGLKVCIYPGYISVTGSLPKYLYQNNIYPLDRHSTAQAIEKLSDDLHIEMRKARVTGLEFGKPFLMAHKVESYLSRLGEMPKLLRYHFEPGTLYYKPRGKRQPKVFAFYDKKADAEAKDMVLPDGFADANLLKYEMRLNERLNKQIGVPEVKAATLSESGVYRLLVKQYQESYFNISKLNKVKSTDMSDIKTVSDAFKLLVARLINQSDPTQITAFMDELKDARVFDDKKYYTRLKNKIQEVATKAEFIVSDELIKELDDEVRNAGCYE